MATAIALLQWTLWLLLIAAALHLLRSAWSARGPLGDAPPPIERDFPTVTVQLPLRNERAVAARVIRLACALDWPRDRLQVQVLDDSDDETAAIVDRAVEELRASGADVAIVRRGSRAG